MARGQTRPLARAPSAAVLILARGKPFPSPREPNVDSQSGKRVVRQSEAVEARAARPKVRLFEALPEVERGGQQAMGERVTVRPGKVIGDGKKPREQIVGAGEDGRLLDGCHSALEIGTYRTRKVGSTGR